LFFVKGTSSIQKFHFCGSVGDKKLNGTLVGNMHAICTHYKSCMIFSHYKHESPLAAFSLRSGKAVIPAIQFMIFVGK